MTVAATQEDVGRHVEYYNPVGKKFDALLTAVWGSACVNLLYVVDDNSQTDNYGRKIDRSQTSLMHGNVQQAHGQYWLWPQEERQTPKV